MEKKVALVTGASAGIGMDAALQLAAAGFITYAAARRVDRMESLRAHGIKVLPLDITDEQSIAACLAAIKAESGGIDVLVNNAGYGAYGALEEVPMSEARRQFDVNLFGLARLTQQAIPHMRQRRWGRIINVSSIGGVGAAPYGGWYHATKFALEGYSAALRQELAPFGVNVVVIRPGGTVSEWAEIATNSLEATSGRGPYAVAVQAMVNMFRAGLGNSKLIEPASVIGDLILKAATVARPKSVYLAPRMAKIAVFLRWMLSDRLHDAMVRSMMKLPKVMQ
jgi:short-subunit dehydrogenase